MKGSGKKSKAKKSLTPSSSPLHPSASSNTLELSQEGATLLPVIVQSDLPPNELYLSPSLVQALAILPACYVALVFPSGQSILVRLSTATKGLASFAEYKRIAVINKIWTPNLTSVIDGLEEEDRSISVDMNLMKMSRILPCKTLYVALSASSGAIADPIYLLSYVKEVMLGCCLTHLLTICIPYKGSKITMTLHLYATQSDADVLDEQKAAYTYFQEVSVSTRVSMLPTSVPFDHLTPDSSPHMRNYESVLRAVQTTFAGFDAEVAMTVKTMFSSLFPSATHRLTDGTSSVQNQIDSLLVQSSERPQSASPPAQAKKYKGLILSGPPGSGKSLLAHSICTNLGIHTINLDPTTLYNTQTQSPSQLEDSLRKIFGMARESAPCVIVMDHMHLLLPSRSSATVSAEMKRFVSCWLTLVDGAEQLDGVFILGLTASVDDVDAAARRAGRIDLEVELPVPSSGDRLCILRNMLSKSSIAIVSDDDASLESDGSIYIRQRTLQYLADNAHGMVASDLLLLIKEACFFYTKRVAAAADIDIFKTLIQSVGNLSIVESSSPPPLPLQVNLEVTINDFQSALRTIKPSAIREVAIEVPKVYWTDIGGMEGVKKAVRQVIEYPLLYPDVYQKMSAGDVNSLKGVLLYGPPGCSKTLLAKAIATETSMNFLAVRGPELLSKWVGESEKAVQRLFKRARAVAPAIVFFDEIDALAGVRGDKSSGVSDRVLSQLLTELDGIQGWRQVIVIAATNRPDMLDPALIRPGRIDRKIYVPPPDDASRLSILQLELSKLPVQGVIDSTKLVQISRGFSGAEMVSICNDAALQAIEADVDYVTEEMLLSACKKITPQITSNMITFYENFRSKNRTF